MKNGHSEEFLLKQQRRISLYASLRSQGMTYEDIAKNTGTSKEMVERVCRENGLGYSEEERKRIYLNSAKYNKSCYKPSVNWQERVDKYYNGSGIAEVLSVDRTDDGESRLTIKCTTCGSVRTLFSSTLRKSHNGYCDICRKVETEKRKLNERLDRQETKERERRHNRKIIQLAIPFCDYCGMIVPRGHRVCEECKKQNNKELWRRADIKRRSRIDSSIKDKDISLQKLYERDNGVCYICGRVCDWNDSEWKDGVFRVGKNYPTIEHLKPLSKGGTHTWSNIKLACLSCNAKKYNREAV